MTDTKVIRREPTEEMLRIGYEAAAFPRDAEICVAMFKAMFDAAPSLNPWVSVKERLPEPDVYVLIYNGKWIGVGRHRPLDDGYMEESERWQSETSEFIEHLGPKVTHWMPLPEPPDEASMPIPRPK